MSVRLRRVVGSAEPYLYASPVMLLIVAVMLVPLAVGLSYAFRDLLLLDPSGGRFIGLVHFEELSDDPIFRDSLFNTVIWTGATVALQFVLGLILALLLNREFPGRRLVQALVFLPWAVPTFLVGLDWAWLFNPVIGPLPHWLLASASGAQRQQSAGRSAPRIDRPNRRRRLVGHTVLRHHDIGGAAIDTEGSV